MSKKKNKAYKNHYPASGKIVFSSSKPKPVVNTVKLTKEFYTCRAWRELRYKALKATDGRCGLCGRSAKDGIVLHVDHIKPISKFPKLILTLSNLQVLCEDCNIGKSNKDVTDWRSDATKEIQMFPDLDKEYADIMR